jgi:uncharacterized protein YecE (DUF72 family)
MDAAGTPGAVIRVGTSGYNYPEWRGRFYPVGLPASRMFGFYAERFSTVEINATFYRMPAPKTVTAWAAAAPAGFTFALKAPQRITHFGRLRGVEDPVRFFCDTARLLGDRLGPLLFQLPPTFRKDTGRLDAVLGLLPPDLRVAFEFRHASWFTDDVYDRLRARNTALCIVDTGEGATPAVATADFGYVRLRAVDYPDADLQRWVDTVRTLGAAWPEAFVFFKHEEAGTGPELARRLQGLLDPAPPGESRGRRV